MKSRPFSVSLLFGAISLSLVIAGQLPGQSEPKEAARDREQPSDALLRLCHKMLDLQTAIYTGTECLHKVIEGMPDKKARPSDMQALVVLSDDAKRIVETATSVIDILEAEGSAAALCKVVQELREDMKRVQCLSKTATSAWKHRPPSGRSSTSSRT
jgi:hypothetical protein